MYGAGRSVFAVNFRVTAVEAFLAHKNIVFHAFITGFSIRVIHAVSQVNFLLQIFQRLLALFAQAL